MHVDGSGTRIGSFDYPLVCVFGHEFVRDGIDAIVGRRHRDAGAHGTGPGRLKRFGDGKAKIDALFLNLPGVSARKINGLDAYFVSDKMFACIEFVKTGRTR